MPEFIITPSSKAAVGEHDENIDYVRCEAPLGPHLATQVRDAALALYKKRRGALTHGIIIAGF